MIGNDIKRRVFQSTKKEVLKAFMIRKTRYYYCGVTSHLFKQVPVNIKYYMKFE